MNTFDKVINLQRKLFLALEGMNEKLFNNLKLSTAITEASMKNSGTLFKKTEVYKTLEKKHWV